MEWKKNGKRKRRKKEDDDEAFWSNKTRAMTKKNTHTHFHSQSHSHSHTYTHTKVYEKTQKTETSEAEFQSSETITSLGLYLIFYCTYIFTHDLDYFQCNRLILPVFFSSLFLRTHFSKAFFRWSICTHSTTSTLIPIWSMIQHTYEYVCMQMLIKPAVTLNSWSFIVAVVLLGFHPNWSTFWCWQKYQSMPLERNDKSHHHHHYHQYHHNHNQ